MDTLKYLKAQSGLVQDFLQKEDEDNAKNEDTVLRDDTLGSLGLPASADVLKSSLTTESMKTQRVLPFLRYTNEFVAPNRHQKPVY